MTGLVLRGLWEPKPFSSRVQEADAAIPTLVAVLTKTKPSEHYKNNSALRSKYGSKLSKTLKKLNPHRNPTLSHKRLGLPHREFAIVKNTRGQHSICAADFDAICQMSQRAHTT